jgi:hypothetical protein
MVFQRAASRSGRRRAGSARQIESSSSSAAGFMRFAAGSPCDDRPAVRRRLAARTRVCRPSSRQLRAAEGRLQKARATKRTALGSTAKGSSLRKLTKHTRSAPCASALFERFGFCARRHRQRALGPQRRSRRRSRRRAPDRPTHSTYSPWSRERRDRKRRRISLARA